ncbi:hypothetical protein [Bradyrhizobium sp. USDA 4520]
MLVATHSGDLCTAVAPRLTERDWRCGPFCGRSLTRHETSCYYFDYMAVRAISVLFVLLIVIALSIAAAPGNSQPLQPGNSQSAQVQIIDKYTSPNSAIQSLQGVSNPAFRAFVSKVLEHVQDRLGGHTITFDVNTGATAGTLHFVRIAVVSSGDRIPANETAAAVPTENYCLLHSPWAEIAISGTQTPRISGTFFWNERQILQDQAILANLTDVPSAPREALPRSLFEQFAQEYANNEILGKPAEPSTVQRPQYIPADVLWLFRHSPQSTFGPFSTAADATMRKIAQRAAGFYAELVVGLVDQCLKFPAVRHEYNSILDVRGIIHPETYDVK